MSVQGVKSAAKCSCLIPIQCWRLTSAGGNECSELLQNAVRVISGGGSGAGIDHKVDTLAQEMRSFMGRSQGGGLHPPGPTRNCATHAASSRCPRAQLSLRH